MTAINFVANATGAHIISDGAFVDATGILRHIAPKVLPMPHQCAAVAIRGAGNVLPLLWHQLVRLAPDFDNLVPLFSAQCKQTCAELEAAAGPIGRIEFILAGWSYRRDRAVGYLMVNQVALDNADCWPAPWELKDLDEGSVLPLPGPTEMKLANFIMPEPKDFDALRDGLRLLDAQRHLKLPFDAADPDGPRGCNIGGFKQLTSVSRFATQSSVIQRWPDKLGERIVP